MTRGSNTVMNLKLWRGCGCAPVRDTKSYTEVTMRGRPAQQIAAALLVYAAYLTWKCPCRRIISCHWSHYFLSVGTATSIILYDNMSHMRA